MSKPSQRFSTEYKLNNKEEWQIPMANYVRKMATPLVTKAVQSMIPKPIEDKIYNLYNYAIGAKAKNISELKNPLFHHTISHQTIVHSTILSATRDKFKSHKATT